MDAKWKPVGGLGGDLLKWERDGQNLEGLWLGLHDGKFGPLGSLQLPDGTKVRFPCHTALLDRVKRVKEGAEIFIQYLGKQKSKAGREFKAFEVFIANPDDLEPESDGEAPF